MKLLCVCVCVCVVLCYTVSVCGMCGGWLVMVVYMGCTHGYLGAPHAGLIGEHSSGKTIPATSSCRRPLLMDLEDKAMHSILL